MGEKNVYNNTGNQEKLASPSWGFSVRNIRQTEDNEDHKSKETRRFSGKLVSRIPSKISLRLTEKDRIWKQWGGWEWKRQGSQLYTELSTIKATKDTSPSCVWLLWNVVWYYQTHLLPDWILLDNGLNSKSFPNMGGVFSRLTVLCAPGWVPCLLNHIYLLAYSSPLFH